MPAMTSTTPPRLFDRTLLRRRRDRAARKLADYNFLVRRAFDDICDRVESITRDFDRAAILGGGPGLMDELAARPASAPHLCLYLHLYLSLSPLLRPSVRY